MSNHEIFEKLKSDHNRHRDLLEQISGTIGDSNERKQMFEDLRKELQAHAAAEEESLYATMLADPELRDDARHSVSEHKEIDDFLGELIETDMSSPAWLTKFKQMRARYLHHIDEEEQDMFPKAAKKLDADVEREMTETFDERKPRELAAAEHEMPGDDKD